MERDQDGIEMGEAFEPTLNNGDMARLSPVLAALTALSQPYRLMLFRVILAAGDAAPTRPALGARLRRAGTPLPSPLPPLAAAQLIEPRRKPDGGHVCIARRDYLRGLMDWVVEPSI